MESGGEGLGVIRPDRSISLGGELSEGTSVGSIVIDGFGVTVGNSDGEDDGISEAVGGHAGWAASLCTRNIQGIKINLVNVFILNCHNRIVYKKESFKIDR